MSEPKVTECWALPCQDFSPGCPVDYIKWTSHADAAILLWREDYEQLKAKADTAEFVESVNRSLIKRGDTYFEKLKQLLPREEMSRLIDEATK